MYREFFRGLDSPVLPIAAMLFFVVAFVLVLLRTFVWKRKRDYESDAALPLAGDEPNSRNPRQEVKP